MALFKNGANLLETFRFGDQPTSNQIFVNLGPENKIWLQAMEDCSQNDSPDISVSFSGFMLWLHIVT